MPKFKVGDRVKCIAKHDGNTYIIGQVGTVLSYSDVFNAYGVVFDNDVNGIAISSVNNVCEEGHGWFIPPEKLVLLSPHAGKVIIYHKDNRTIAKYIANKQVMATAYATCSPADNFSIFTGAQIALARLSQQHDAKPVILKETLDKALENFEIIE